MIDCIFTIDYEIYGNGEGSLHDLAFLPTEKLIDVFEIYDQRYVVFVEAAELEMIESSGTDSAIDAVKDQLRHLHKHGYELGLHVHPGWYNAEYDNKNNNWDIDYNDYNLSALPEERIVQILGRAISHMKKILNEDDFTPVSFRSGHLLFQPSGSLASALSALGIKVDSSLYKGGLWRQQNQDYRKAIRNAYYWRFTNDINVSDDNGVLLELPIYTRMVPPWRMLTYKRVGIQGLGSSVKQTSKKLFSRVKDYTRFSYPLKFDIGQMKTEEILKMMSGIIQIENQDPSSYKPIVIIGHTKDLADLTHVEELLSYLKRHSISVSTLDDAYHKCFTSNS
jgi:hypothetical protein